ncbi:hypothetical protein PQX77_020251 [Marasmius sp. AFHP31]|nr:hypothetical protein PQX77_020251 [Marasmius sp. AFHP31]
MGSRTSLWRTKNITYDDRDTNNLKYGSNWFHDGTWNASSVGHTGTLSSSNDLNATVTFIFSRPAVAFHYFGILRSRGGLYDICIDCDPNKPTFQPIDAFNGTDDGANPPTSLQAALFSKRFDTPAQHVVLLINRSDQRGVPAGNSQITIDRFVLEVEDNSLVATTSPSATLPSTALPSTSTSESVTILSNSPSSTSVSDEKGTPIGAIIGHIIGGTLLGIIIIVTGLYCRHRRKRRTKSFAHDDVNTGGEASFPIIVPYALMHPSISREERPKAGESRCTPQRTTRPTSSSGSESIVVYSRSRRRERQREIGLRRLERQEADAGPVPPEDERCTLPPSYEQVFRADSSICLPPGQAQ